MEGSSGTLSDLARLIADCPPAWRSGFQARQRGLHRRARAGKPYHRGRRALAADVLRVLARRDARLAVSLTPDFDLDLPVIERRDAIAEAIDRHQVVIVCGETGSGKSTQLPKICLALGRGLDGVIGHTQPRRIAARSLAARLAEECATTFGQGVGYRIRFSDRVGPGTRVKLVTDGMLLAETQGDPTLAEYDTLIIDEAHERSLNIDFLLGYLKRLLARRPDLKIIITSATIDPERFSRHFDDAPIVEVSGRGYPVEVRYRPLVSADPEERDRSLTTGILEAVDELAAAGPGDVLVFLPGERDIREMSEALRKHHPPNTEILPLYGRLSSAEQQRVFAPHRHRRVVLATNVAETSLTVPGIRYVVDTGLARLSRYSYRTKVQRLPVEPVSQASANQRAGRCGRVAPGICIRLYTEADFLSRPEYTDPEILRTNLAAVILQMKYLGLGAIESFPFIEPPDPRFVRDGIRLLHELNAVDSAQRLTELGRRLARLPVDPRIGRMLIAGDDQGCLAEVLVIAAALSVQDPRERPLEARSAADQAHARWRDEKSDFLALLHLWHGFRDAGARRSQRKLRDWCREHYLSWLRFREWRDVHRQLRELAKGMGLRENDQAADPVAIHRALLSGLLSNVALRNAQSDYTGARGLTLAVFPGSGLAKRQPKWIVAAELVETSRVFARTVAEVRPEWIEPLASHLIARQHYEPYWEERRGRVAGFEDVTLYGLPLASRRRINYARVAPAEARQVFIREALVRGRFRTRGRFLEHNRNLVAELEALEAKTRRRDVLVDEEALFALYAERLPAQAVDGPSFERWVADPDNDQALLFGREQLLRQGAVAYTTEEYPDQLTVNGIRLPLRYHFEPGDPGDGVTVQIPLAALNQVSPEPFEWLVPGLRTEKVSALIRALPKPLRKNFVPAPDFAAAVLAAVPPGEGSLLEAVRRELRRMTGVEIPLDAWDGVELPAHLRMGFRVVDADGAPLKQGRDLRALQTELQGQARREFRATETGGYPRTGLQRWEVGALPEEIDIERGGVRLRGFPALVDEGESVALRLLDAPGAAATAHRGGVRRLLMRALGQQVRYLRRSLPGMDRLCLLYRSLGSCAALQDDIVVALLDRVFLADGVPRDETGFRHCLEQGRGILVPTAETLASTLESILTRHHALRQRLQGGMPLPLADAGRDMKEQLEHLVYPGFVRTTPQERLGELPRYLDGIARRLERLDRAPGRDTEPRRRIRAHWARYLARREQHRLHEVDDPILTQYRWLLEEYRISLFAQELGTSEKVSERRLQQVWENIQ